MAIDLNEIRAARNLTPQQIEDAKASVLLSDLVSSRVNLKRRGNEYVGLCPFHNEKTPSFTVNDAKGFYHCFGCGANGDAISWLRETKDLTFDEAVAEIRNGTKVYNNSKKVDKEPEWQSILPAPVNPPDPPRHPVHGAPQWTWTYMDRDGKLLFLVCRWDNADKRKIICPLTYGILDGEEGWHWKHPIPPRPLYGLNRLDQNKANPVVLCEGEKAADAAQKLMPDYSCLSWPAGSGNIRHTDWSPLKGREILIWPDADEPGMKCARELEKTLAAL